MKLWRISEFRSLEGVGGMLYSARWHTAGHPIVYLAESAPGAMLEMLVHLELEDEDLPSGYSLLQVEVPDDITVVALVEVGSSVYRDNLRTSRSLGDRWLEGLTSALAAVPSAIMPNTQNYLFNPLHPDAARIKVIGVSKANYDPRLLRSLGKDVT